MYAFKARKFRKLQEMINILIKNRRAVVEKTSLGFKMTPGVSIVLK